MANIVAGFGVPHTPVFPFFVKRDGPESETAKLFAAQKEQLSAVRPDVIVMFDTDHLNTFFLDNLPIFAVGVDKSFTGPNDEPREMPVYTIPSALDLAAHIRQASIEAGFDTALTQHFSVDHSVAVPLHFLTPDMKCRSSRSSSAGTCRRYRRRNAVTRSAKPSAPPSPHGRIRCAS